MKRVLFIFIFVIAAVVMTGCCGCKNVPTVPPDAVPVVTLPVTLIVNHYEHDTLIVHEKEVIETKGDTVYNTKYVEKEKVKTVHDTVSHTEYVPQPYPVEVEKKVEVEVNKLYWWQKAPMWAGVISIILGGLWLWRRLKI